MNYCSSGKNFYLTRVIAEEALSELRKRVDFRAGTGPKSVYRCEECGGWHFTSKSSATDLFSHLNRKPK